MSLQNSFLLLLLFIHSVILETGCNKTEKKKKVLTQQEQEYQNKMLKANRAVIKNESDEIEAYIKRRGWSMTSTGTGLRYMIYEKGDGPAPKPGMMAKINYKVSLLDGTVCYSSDKTGPQEFKVSEDHVESGLHEGILLMHTGDKAKFIMPPHLAHGLIGDDNKIPAMSTIIYDVELLSIR
jgi:FKBP-type peptidyl-prolyl cis-trans isomerase